MIILQIENTNSNRLILFPAGPAIEVSPQLARRHTHSLILRYSEDLGLDVWLDDTLVVQNAANPAPALSQGPVLLLHDGGFMGSAQCWFHEAAMWERRLPDGDLARLRVHASRWFRGSRKGVTLLINGQSNAVNYALNDGAAEVLAEGVAWHVGALAWNIFATTGNSTSHTMQSGHGLYQVQGGAYPGSFLDDPLDGSDPTFWPLGSDGIALQTAIQSLSPADREDVRAIIWPWSETDSLRSGSELSTFVAAMKRFIGLERSMVGATADKLPLVAWSAVPYGTLDGTMMHRQAIDNLARSSSLNVVIGNPQTADSNSRGASWNEISGIAIGGDAAHRDSDDNRRFARLAAPVVARAILRSTGGDSIADIPLGLPTNGGPRIVHAYRLSDTEVVLTVEHDSGSDLLVPRQADTGRGFAITDGATAAGPDGTARAVHCERINPTQLRITLTRPLQNPSAHCYLHYPLGGEAIGRGNAVTDNFGKLAKPEGWDIRADLGTAWDVDYPLAATLVPLPLSDTPFSPTSNI